MSQPELRAHLLDRDAGAPPSLDDDQRFLLSHFVTVAALLEHYVPLHRELWDRVQDEGPSDDTRAVALDAAEKLATVAQPLARRNPLVVATQGTPLNASPAVMALQQLFCSFTLLAGPEDELSAGVLPPPLLDELLDLPGLRDWLREMGVEPPEAGPAAGG